MQIFKIKKRNGKFRTIYAPSPEEKAASASHVKYFMDAAKKADIHGVQHGFTDGRSPVTNAMAHRGWRYTLSFDLQDFFDSVRPRHVIWRDLPRAKQYRSGWNMDEAISLDINCIGKQFNKSQLNSCFYDGAARQGLPSSPAVANLAAAPMDNEIMKLRVRSRLGWSFVYTRYADDLTFSFNGQEIGEMLMREIPKIVESYEFKINEAKTHLQCSASCRRIITGVSVGDDVRMTRATRRKIRAARHQLRTKIRPRNLRRILAKLHLIRARGEVSSIGTLLVLGYRGLKEWSRLRLPKEYEKEEEARKAAQKAPGSSTARQAADSAISAPQNAAAHPASNLPRKFA